ncbi:PREDICTED: serglycin [Ceratotherium simum simum]|uniref:Serglycin n=1 Tax=Ceratotherium simum simum TaxID=73337 RepID=A0ABM0HHD2_CERSS|nr:PREDICTED: serglycin [Ceratotherium simum simum]
MQVLLQGSRLILALALILVLDSSIQGIPVQRARYQWVRCSPDSNSANCIDEKGPVFDLLPGESNRILPPRTGPFSMTRSQNLNDVFPLSEDYSGSGSGSGAGSGSGSGNGFLTDIEQEYQPVDENDAFYYKFRSRERNLPSDNQDLGQDGPEENFII